MDTRQVLIVHFFRDTQSQSCSRIDLKPAVVVVLIPAIILDANTNKTVFENVEQHRCKIELCFVYNSLIYEVVNC